MVTENVNKCYADRSAGGMAEEINVNKVATEATEVKGAASIYYTLAVEKVKDVSCLISATLTEGS